MSPKIGVYRNNELLRTITAHRDSLYAAALSPDGQTLVSGSRDKTARMWDVKTGATGWPGRHVTLTQLAETSADGRPILTISPSKLPMPGINSIF